jgi:hypothetical protein
MVVRKRKKSKDKKLYMLMAAGVIIAILLMLVGVWIYTEFYKMDIRFSPQEGSNANSAPNIPFAQNPTSLGNSSNFILAAVIILIIAGLVLMALTVVILFR